MEREFKELPNWSFAADEVSAGVYRAFGREWAGRTVEATGPDPDVLTEKCKQAATQMMADSQKPSVDLDKQQIWRIACEGWS